MKGEFVGNMKVKITWISDKKQLIIILACS